MDKNKCLNSWHSFYSTKKNKHDSRKEKLSNFRNFSKSLYTEFEQKNLLDKTIITVSMNTNFLIESDDKKIIFSLDFSKNEININLNNIDLKYNLNECLKKIVDYFL
jgi:hypothetical protein